MSSSSPHRLLLEALRTQVHLWVAYPGQIHDPSLLARYRSWLSADELSKVERYRRANDRHLSLVAQALVRSTLSYYSSLAESQWHFQIEEHGRPEISGYQAGVPSDGLRFNLSHTAGMVVCVVSRSIDCGVDVERLDRKVDASRVAGRYFSADECADLFKLPAAERSRRFIDYWTLKEAYIKARGLGLRLPLKKFSFRLKSEAIAIVFDSTIRDVAGDWQFWIDSIGSAHRVALAVRSGGQRRQVIVREVIPGVLD